MKTLLKNRELSAFLAILALFVVLVALNPSFFSLQTVGMIFASSQILMLLALGATLVMLTRNIDVSVGSTVGLCAIAVGVALNSGYSLPVAMLFSLMIGALAGAFNGLLVVGLKIPAIVATLGTLGLYRGAMLLWTGGKWIEGLPASLKSLSVAGAIGVSPLGWLVLLMLGAGTWMLARTAFGRDFYAVGDNLAAARQLGVAVNRTRMLAFTLNGVLAACAGIVFASQIGFVPNQTGSGLEMKAIAACVLGGISLLGGTGTLIGAFLGAFFLTQIDTVLVLFKLPAWWNDFIAGLVLLGGRFPFAGQSECFAIGLRNAHTILSLFRRLVEVGKLLFRRRRTLRLFQTLIAMVTDPLSVLIVQTTLHHLNPSGCRPTVEPACL